jgi:hypothetical protein
MPDRDFDDALPQDEQVRGLDEDEDFEEIEDEGEEEQLDEDE